MWQWVSPLGARVPSKALTCKTLSTKPTEPQSFDRGSVYVSRHSPSCVSRYHVDMDDTINAATIRLSEEEAFRLFGKARLMAFYAESNDLDQALGAYAWEMHLRQSLLKPIGITEVFLRNAMDNAIRHWWNGHQLPGDWLDATIDFEIPEPIASFRKVNAWRGRAATNLKGCKTKEQISHDDIIAHMMLGTWRNMIGNPASVSPEPPDDAEKRQSWRGLRKSDAKCAALWKEITHAAFPNMPTKSGRGRMSPRAYIGSKLAVMSALRNRVCHWDNLIHVNVAARYADMQSIVAAISLPGVEWLREQTEADFMEVLSRRPAWLESHLTHERMPFI